MDELKPEDVMRALELCKSFRDLHACDVCPYFRAELGDDESCTNRMAQDALAIIHEKDEEIKRLKSEISVKRKLLNKCDDLIVSIRSQTITEFAERLKEAPIKCGLPLLGLQTKGEIEEYFNGIMLQVRDAIDGIAEELKGEQQ